MKENLSVTEPSHGQQNVADEELPNAGDAERAMLALTDPLYWEGGDSPGNPYQPRGSKDGIVHYYIRTPEFSRKPQLTQATGFIVIFHRKKDGRAIELMVKGIRKVRRFETVDEAKAACECHFATGEWPQ